MSSTTIMRDPCVAVSRFGTSGPFRCRNGPGHGRSGPCLIMPDGIVVGDASTTPSGLTAHWAIDLRHPRRSGPVPGSRLCPRFEALTLQHRGQETETVRGTAIGGGSAVN